MKPPKLLTTLFALICLSISCAFGQPPAVQAMVKHQPFPYATGVALDSALYSGVKAKLAAAEKLRIESERTIKILQASITATRQALDDQFRLQQYDQKRADSLTVQLQLFQRDLATAQYERVRALTAIDEVLKELPRRERKRLIGATPDQIATAVVDYIHTLQARKWKWAGFSTLFGAVAVVTARFFL